MMQQITATVSAAQTAEAALVGTLDRAAAALDQIGLSPVQDALQRLQQSAAGAQARLSLAKDSAGFLLAEALRGFTSLAEGLTAPAPAPLALPAAPPVAAQDAAEAPADPTPTLTVEPAPEASQEAGQPASEEVVATAANAPAATVEPPALEPVPEVPAPAEEAVEPAGQERPEEVLTLAQAQRMRKADLRELAQRRGCDVGDDDTKGAILDALTAAGIVS